MKAGTLVTLSEECELITKGTTPSTLGFEVRDGGIPFVRAQNLVDGTVSVAADPLFIDTATHNALMRSQIQPRDVLLSIAGTIGRAAIVPDDVVAMNCNQAVAIIRPSQRIDRRFLLHWFGSRDAQSQVARGKVTATISNLSLGQIGALRIPLPALDEQRRIAAMLDKANALLRKRKRALELLDTLTQSIFLEMFGDPVSNKRGWPSATLGALNVEMTYGPRFYNEQYSQDGVRIVRITDLADNGTLNFDAMPKLSVSAADLELHRSRPGELLFARTGATVGKIALMMEDQPLTIPGAYFIRLKFPRTLLPLFAWHTLRCSSIQRIISEGSH